jgi:hypothetical protein
MRLPLVLAIATVALGGTGVAFALTPEHTTLIDTTVRYLQETQDTSGGFAEPGGEPSQGISAWVALALAADGINPQDQARCGSSVLEFLEGHFPQGLEEELAWPQVAVTTLERELLVVDAAGTDPHDFAGHDLVAEILARRLADGSFPYTPDGTQGESNDTIFAILALAPVHEGAAEEAVAAAREWVVSAQLEDGGWYYAGKSPKSEVDMTGAAIEALVVAGPPSEEPALGEYRAALAAGLGYLKEAQLPDGGFPALPSGETESNVASTAWAVQAIWAVGQDPEAWTAGPEGREPLDYLESMQQPDGHIRWRASTDMNGIWMTAYVTPAFAGRALPIPVAARGSAAAQRGEAAACLKTGDEEGTAPHPQEGVIAGGGGHGAPSFSRPKAGSEGRTPGGARVVRGQGLEPRNHSPHRRRGANSDQARGTETAEPRSAAEADQEVEAVTAGPATGSTPDQEVEAVAAAPEPGGDGARGDRVGKRGAPLPVTGEPRAAKARSDEEVSGVVIGSPEGKRNGRLAFGAPGLRSAGAGAAEEPWTAVAIGGAALLAALLGAGWERRQGRPA